MIIVVSLHVAYTKCEVSKFKLISLCLLYTKCNVNKSELVSLCLPCTKCEVSIMSSTHQMFMTH